MLELLLAILCRINANLNNFNFDIFGYADNILIFQRT